MKKINFKNRYRVLVVTISLFMAVVVLEGFVTQRERRVFEINNPFLELRSNNLDGFVENLQRNSDR